MPRVSEERRRERREQILGAARDAFIRNGFHETSMDDIIAAAGMSAGGVYRYFPSKESIISAIASRSVGTLTGALGEILTEDPPPSLGESVARMLRVIDSLAGTVGRLALQVWGEAQRDPAIAELAAGEATRIRSAVVEMARHAAREGDAPPGIDPVALGDVLVALGQGYLVKRLLLPDVDVERDIRTVRALLGATDGS